MVEETGFEPTASWSRTASILSLFCDLPCGQSHFSLRISFSPKIYNFRGPLFALGSFPKGVSLSPRAYKTDRKNPVRFCMVEETGFEPTASWSRTKRATKLRYSSLFVCYFSTAIIFLQLFSSFIINDKVVLSETTDLRQRLFNKSVELREAHHSVFVVGNNYLVHASVLMRRQFFPSRDYVFCIETGS